MFKIDANQLIESRLYQQQLAIKIKHLEENSGLLFISEIFHALKDNPNALNIFRDIVFFSSDQKLAVYRYINEQTPLGWEWFIRKNCIHVNSGEYGKDPNYIFGNACHEEVLVQLERLRHGKITSLRDIFNACAERRKEIAKQTQTKNWNQFGEICEDEAELLYTPIKNGFSHYADKIQETLGIMIKNLKPIKEQEGLVFYNIENTESRFYVVTKEEKIVYICVRIKVDTNEFVTANRIILDSAGLIANSYFENDSLLLLCMDPEDRKKVILHCPRRNIAKLWNTADILFKELIQQDICKAKSQILAKIATLHHLLANIVLTKRGNAAISEMVAVPLLLFHDFFITPYKTQIMADMEALTTPLEDFVVNYNFFREVDLMSASPVKRKLLTFFGGTNNFNKLPLFPFDREKHMGLTHYLNIKNEEVRDEVSHFVDQFRRDVIVKKSYCSKPHIIFQRVTSGENWHYVKPYGGVTNNPEEFPFDFSC